MSEVEDAVSEAIEQGRDSRLNAAVAILVALTATFMALCNVKDGNIGQGMAQAQAKTVDTWSYYQAKSTKQNLAEATVDQLKAMMLIATPEARPAIQKSIDDFAARVVRYEKEKNDIKAQAEQYQKTYDELNFHDDQFDMSDAALSVSIALFGITALTRKRWLLGIAIVFMLYGVFFGVAGFAGWTIHPDKLMSWLS
jgi:hypothetical protein